MHYDQLNILYRWENDVCNATRHKWSVNVQTLQGYSFVMTSHSDNALTLAKNNLVVLQTANNYSLCNKNALYVDNDDE